MSHKVETVLIQDRGEQQATDQNKLDESFDERDQDQKPYNNHQFDDEQLGGLLQQEQATKEQMMLRFKVEELQKICSSLSETNRKLINKVTKMQKQLEQKQKEEQSSQQIFVDQYSQLNCQFTEIQELINEYRQSLNNFQVTVLSDLKTKEKSHEKLNEQVRKLKQEIKNLGIEKEEIEKINKQLETRNQGLILQIQALEKNNSWLEQRLSSGKNYNSYHNNNLPSNRYDNSYIYQNEDDISSQMQAELQGIINKLVKQLQYERNIKKKLNEEIKRMSVELLESERQIMDKNRKLYELQMKMLKSTKSTVGISDSSAYRYRQKLDEQKTQRNPNSKAENMRISFKNFSLLQIINNQTDQQISALERKIIGQKIVQLYERKLEKEDYTSTMPENLLVHNFNHKRHELISIRKNGASLSQDNQQQSQGSLLWNLAFILENLFSDSNEPDYQFEDILAVVRQMLDNDQENNRQDIQNIKKILSS